MKPTFTIAVTGTTSVPPPFQPPEGFAFVINAEGLYLLDASGNYVVKEI